MTSQITRRPVPGVCSPRFHDAGRRVTGDESAERAWWGRVGIDSRSVVLGETISRFPDASTAGSRRQPEPFAPSLPDAGEGVPESGGAGQARAPPRARGKYSGRRSAVLIHYLTAGVQGGPLESSSSAGGRKAARSRGIWDVVVTPTARGTAFH
jgi:hypothetical protein